MPFYGEGLDGLMRARSGDLRGIVNGIDYDEFNPETDKLIAQPYNARISARKKAKIRNSCSTAWPSVDEKKFMVALFPA